jgi:hypothetical protein
LEDIGLFASLSTKTLDKGEEFSGEIVRELLVGFFFPIGWRKLTGLDEVFNVHYFEDF